MHKIRLELARNEGFPNGSSFHGYEIVAPLNEKNHLDHVAWRKLREKCRVVKFWGHAEHQVGHLGHNQGGTWYFHYDVAGDENADDKGFKFHTEAFVAGEYVSVLEADGDEMIYQVVSVEEIMLPVGSP